MAVILGCGQMISLLLPIIRIIFIHSSLTNGAIGTIVALGLHSRD